MSRYDKFEAHRAKMRRKKKSRRTRPPMPAPTLDESLRAMWNGYDTAMAKLTAAPGFTIVGNDEITISTRGLGAPPSGMIWAGDTASAKTLKDDHDAE